MFPDSNNNIFDANVKDKIREISDKNKCSTNILKFKKDDVNKKYPKYFPSYKLCQE